MWRTTFEQYASPFPTDEEGKHFVVWERLVVVPVQMLIEKDADNSDDSHGETSDS